MSVHDADGEIGAPWVFDAMLTDGSDDGFGYGSSSGSDGAGVTGTSPGSTAPGTTVMAPPRPRPTPRPKPGPGGAARGYRDDLVVFAGQRRPRAG